MGRGPAPRAAVGERGRGGGLEAAGREGPQVRALAARGLGDDGGGGVIDHMIFKVEYTALARGHQITVDAGEERLGTIVAPSVREAVGFAGAFMRGVLSLDELERAFRMPSAPDGPGEQR